MSVFSKKNQGLVLEISKKKNCFPKPFPVYVNLSLTLLFPVVSSAKFNPFQHGFSKSICKTGSMLLHIFEFIALPVYFQRQVYSIMLKPVTHFL